MKKIYIRKKERKKTLNFHIFDYHSLPQLIVCPQTIYQEKMGRKCIWKKMSVTEKKNVIASPNFAVKPSWGGRICDFQT
jgi:hypothetical protein